MSLHDVNVTIAGLEHCRHGTGSAVVDNLARAQAPHEVVLGGGGRTDDVRTSCLGDLYGDASHAGRRVAQYPLPRPYPGGADEHLPCGEPHQRRGRPGGRFRMCFVSSDGRGAIALNPEVTLDALGGTRAEVVAARFGVVNGRARSLLQVNDTVADAVDDTAWPTTGTIVVGVLAPWSIDPAPGGAVVRAVPAPAVRGTRMPPTVLGFFCATGPQALRLRGRRAGGQGRAGPSARLSCLARMGRTRRCRLFRARCRRRGVGVCTPSSNPRVTASRRPRPLSGTTMC